MVAGRARETLLGSSEARTEPSPPRPSQRCAIPQEDAFGSWGSGPLHCRVLHGAG